MTPTAADLLAGCILTLVTPARPEDAGLFTMARLRTVASINRLVAVESTNAAAVRVWENAALRSLLTDAAPKYPLATNAAAVSDGDYSIDTLDAANATLRWMLIQLHEAAELARDRDLDRTILKLYREIAQRRELWLPPVQPVP